MRLGQMGPSLRQEDEQRPVTRAILLFYGSQTPKNGRRLRLPEPLHHHCLIPSFDGSVMCIGGQSYRESARMRHQKIRLLLGTQH